MKNRTTLAVMATGMGLGFSLSQIGFTDYAQMRGMLTLSDWRLMLVFMGAVAILMGAWRVLDGALRATSRPFHKGTIPGAVLFGAGWALTGVCPAVPLVQLGEGNLAAIVPLMGIIVGALVHPLVHRRFFRWSSGTCET